MYKPFSDSKNIEKMVRQMIVFVEQETLEATMLNWRGNPFLKNYGNWVKYVSSKSKKNPLELFIYWDKKTEDDFLAKLTKEFLSRKGYFEKLEKYFLDSYKNFKNFTDVFLEKGEDFYKKKTNKELIALFQYFSKFNKPALTAYYVNYNAVKLLLRLVRKEIKEIFTDENSNISEKIFKIISSAGINTVIRTERLEFLKRLKIIRGIYKRERNLNDKNINKIIFEHWYNFGPIRYTHEENRSYTIKDYQKVFFENIKINIDSEIKKIKFEESKNRRIIKHYLYKFKKYPQIIKHIKWLRKMMGYRNCESEYYYVYFDHALDFFSEIAKRLKIKAEDLWLLSKEEIIGGLKGKKLNKIINERKKNGLTIKQVGNKIKVWTGIKKEDWHEKEIKNQTILKGMGVYIGKAKNKVKIIFNPKEEANNFQKGDILVTSMTTADFVPLIKKAKAVITDEGGLLCHAAIVARELKTPCIIGTKIATKVLKDGDLVEVDAEKGIVRIIKKTKE